MVTVPWGSIATFHYSRIWNFSAVLTIKKFLGGNLLNLHTVYSILCSNYFPYGNIGLFCDYTKEPGQKAVFSFASQHSTQSDFFLFPNVWDINPFMPAGTNMYRQRTKNAKFSDFDDTWQS